MDRRTAWIVGGAVSVALVGGGAGIAIAASSDTDEPLHGAPFEKATAAALASTHGGTVLETEVGDDGAAYSVEIRLDDGSVVEVGLDATFNVIGQGTDDDGPHDQDGSTDG